MIAGEQGGFVLNGTANLPQSRTVVKTNEIGKFVRKNIVFLKFFVPGSNQQTVLPVNGSLTTGAAIHVALTNCRNQERSWLHKLLLPILPVMLPIGKGFPKIRAVAFLTGIWYYTAKGKHRLAGPRV